MPPPLRLIALIDLFSQEEKVTSTAIQLAEKHAAKLHFVTLFDHIGNLTADHDFTRTPKEQFRYLEAKLLELLIHQTNQLGAKEAVYTVLSGPPSQELSQLASKWGADLILANNSIARTIYNDWMPHAYTATPLPCKLHIVADEEKNPWRFFTRLLRESNLKKFLTPNVHKI
ncbi:MAG: universal stress protein [Magnetococcus sp. DMHC-6]